MQDCIDCGGGNEHGGARCTDCGARLPSATRGHGWRRPDWVARALALLLALALLGGGGWYSAVLLGLGAGPPADTPTTRGTAYPTATFAPLALGSPPPAPRAVVQAQAGVPAGYAGVVGNPGIPAGAPTPLLASVPTAYPTATTRPPTATTMPTSAPPVAAPGALPASLPATLRALPGRSSAALLDLDAPDGAASDDPDMVMPAGALIMLPLAGAAYERVAIGAWQADTIFMLTESDKVGGTGSLRSRPAGTTLPLDDLVALMLTEEDNTAANLVLARLGGVAAVNDYAARLGLRGTMMRRPLYDTAARAAGIENTTTAGDIARLLLLLDRGRVASPAHSARLLGLLQARAQRDPAWLFSSLPPGAGTAHLTGQWPDFRGDAGILRVGGHRYALVLLVQDGDVAAMERGIADVAEASYKALRAR